MGIGVAFSVPVRVVNGCEPALTHRSGRRITAGSAFSLIVRPAGSVQAEAGGRSVPSFPPAARLTSSVMSRASILRDVRILSSTTPQLYSTGPGHINR